ncbi:MAG: GNAT family N-acetyltransferase [Bryobacteraceae bacterium]
MSLIRTGYQQTFEELSSEDPRLGQVSLLPWDTETFGFPVATYRVGAEPLEESLFEDAMVRFASWVREHEVAVCSCVVPAKSRFWRAHLADAGFSFIDFGLRPILTNLSRAPLPDARFLLRPADPNDWQAVEDIALQSFRDGRYHADPLFPASLADLRYRDWMRRALRDQNEINRVYVMGSPGTVEGFYHLTVEGTTSDLRLAAVAPSLKGTMVGFDLYVSALHELRKLGVHRIVTSISAANTSVMNVYAMLGFRFSEPEVIYHWHSEKMASGAMA